MPWVTRLGCRLTEMMLQSYPELRANEYVLQAYYLILNAMEALAAEKKQMVERNQAVLRELVMAAKVSEAQLRSFLAANVDKVRLFAGRLTVSHEALCMQRECRYRRWTSVYFWTRRSRTRSTSRRRSRCCWPSNSTCSRRAPNGQAQRALYLSCDIH